MARLQQVKADWEAELDERSSNGEIGTGPHGDRMVPRAALRELEKAMPEDAMVATDIGNVCSVSNSYLRFKQPNSFLAAMTFGNCGYALPAAMGAKVAAPERPAVCYVGDGAWGMSMNEVLTAVREDIPVTAVVFNNRQWGAEKKNQVLWFGDRYVGTNLKHPRPEMGGCGFAEIAESMGARGVRVNTLEEVGPALAAACEAQKDGVTTVIELMLTRELGDPFRRDAMHLPQRRLKKYAAFCEEAESATGQPVDLGPGREGNTSRDY
jgi:sulfoacetaldehyde acetyltransferase